MKKNIPNYFKIINGRVLSLNLVIILLLLNSINLKAVGDCDQPPEQKYCLGNSLRTSNNSYANPQYIDVRLSNSILSAKTQMTFECWLRPEFTNNKKQYIAGIWGPSQDANDVWVLYHNDKNELVFEVNNPTTAEGDLDNLKCSTLVTSQMYNKWFHIAVTFDGASQTVAMYINGSIMAVTQNTNPAYTFNTLKTVQNNQLTLQIASTNALSNNTSNLSYKGWIDELRLWSRVLTFTEISCQKDLSLNGNEPNLELYYRFNEVPNTFQICDAAGKNNTGFLRSGAKLDLNNVANRPNPRPFKITHDFPDTIKCNSTQTFTFTITDTSLCGSRARIRVLKGNKYLTAPDGSFKTLPPNSPVNFTVNFNSDLIGGFDARIYIERDNRCGGGILNIDKKIYRQTQISVPIDTLEFGILKAKCVQERYIDLPIPIRNTSSKVGVAGVKQITSYSFKNGNRFSVVSPTLPANISIDQSRDLIVRFNNNDIAGTYYDTLYIVTNDNCNGRKAIALSGTIENIVDLKRYGTTNDITDLDFGEICIGIPSSAALFSWENLSSNDITIDSVYCKFPFQMSSVKTPLVLEPQVASREKYIRFFPNVEGTFNDSVIIFFKAGNCLVKRVVNVKGVGIDPKVRFTLPDIDFGNVIIGQETVLNIEVENYGIIAFNVQFDLANGDAFYFQGVRTINVPVGQKRTIPVIFRPTKEEDYFDEIRLYEPRCYKSQGIPIKGKGIIERFKFQPELLRMDFVMACKSKIDTLIIENNSASAQNMRNFILDDPSGKFTLLSPTNLGTFSVNLQPKQKQEFIIEYTPNDVLQDRADRAFLRFKTNDGVDWNAKLLGTSLLPKIYLTDNNVWGTLEVGQNVTKTIILENISAVDIFIDSAKIRDVNGSGSYTLNNSIDLKSKTLKPRDTLHAHVTFNPNNAIDFLSYLEVVSSFPCQISNETSLTGRGRVFPLEVVTNLLSYGFVNPCDCAERKIPMVNNSTVFSARIDDISIVTNNDPDSRPYNFRWVSDFSPNGLVPFDIPPRAKNSYSIDTLRVLFCPKSPNVRDSLNNNAMLKIQSSGNGWSLEMERYLAGKQNLFTEYWPLKNKFPDTRVDVFSAPQYEYLWVPDIDVNPDRSPLVIDSISFTPNDRVFFATDSSGKNFPLTVDPNSYLPIKVEFKPRSVRFYEAKMTVHFRQPCSVTDTTVYVSGRGFAPAFGLKFKFEDVLTTQKIIRDVIKCDTLRLPVFTTRKIPAKYVDIQSMITYNNSEYKFVGLESDYLNKNCNQSFIPAINFANEAVNKIKVNTKNFCDVDSIQPIYYALFTPNTNKATNIEFKVDSIEFDTEDVILYEIIAENANTFANTLDVDYTISKSMNFGNVRILDCSVDSIEVLNNGDVDILVNDLITTHPDIKIISISLDMKSNLKPTEVVKIIFEFCPTQKYDFDEDFVINSLAPCEIIKTDKHKGSSFAPLMTLNPNFIDSVNYVTNFQKYFNDTLVVPIFIDQNLSANYKNIEYWLEDLGFKADIDYNKTALKFLDYTQYTNGNVSLVNTNGLLSFDFLNVDTLRKGKILDLRFKIMVPDSNRTKISTTLKDFISTKIMFLDLQSNTGAANVESLGECALETFIFTNLVANVTQNQPNPWTDYTVIKFTCMEKAPVKLAIYDINGKLIKEVFDGSRDFNLGNYEVQLNKNEFSKGVYYYKFENGVFSQTKKMVVE